jgi:WD40 repeat protein
VARSMIYTVGGTVQANEEGLYILRPADEKLLQFCRTSTFTYILTPRQMGKSSLMIRTVEKLIEEGIQSVIIDLNQIGTKITADEWYSDIIYLVSEQLALSNNAKQWWESNNQFGITLRLTKFFQEVLMVEISAQIVIFIDEIDSTLSLDFTDDFYAAIRYLFMARSMNRELNRLSFVLIGVATPADLIQDIKRTPFNVGQRVDLTDFSESETMPLAQGLSVQESKDREEVVRWVLKWTGGHPYLTQRLFRELVDQIPDRCSESAVDLVVANTFFGAISKQDNNLQFVQDMLIKRSLEKDEVLQTYRQIRRGYTITDEEQSLIKSHLKLSGIVRSKDKILTVRNCIYAEVFEEKWIQAHLSENFWQRYEPVLKWAIPVTAASLIVTVVMTGLYQEAQQQAKVAQLREQAAKVINWLSNTNATEGLVLAIDNWNRSQSIPIVEVTAQSSLLNALQLAKEVNRYQGHSSIRSVAFSPDGLRIVSGSYDKAVRLWDMQTGKLIRQPLRHSSGVRSVAFSPDGLHIVSGSYDKVVRLWDTQTGKLIGQPLQGHFGGIYSVAFSSDGRHIVSGSDDKTARVWDAQTGKLIGQPLKGHSSSVRSVAFSSDGRHIVSGSDDKTVRMWDTQTGKSIGQPFQGHSSTIYSVSFSPDGRHIISGSNDNTVRLWDTQTGKLIGQPLQGHSGGIYSVAFSPDGHRIVSGSYDKTVRLWDAQTGKSIGQPFQGHSSTIYSVSFSPDGRYIVSGSDDNTVRLWNSQIEQLIGQPFQGHSSGIYSVAFSPNGRRIISGSGDNTIRLWDAQNGKPIGQPLQGHSNTIKSVAFSPDGLRIVSGGYDNTIRLWDAQTGKPIGQPLQGHSNVIYSVSFSPDGLRIVSGSYDRTVRLWDAQTGKPIGQPLQGHSGSIYSVVFSPDGRRIISGSGDNTIRLWDAQNGKPIGQPFQGHSSGVYSVAFSLNGHYIVSGSGDNTVRMWDSQTGQPIGQPFRGHSNAVWSAAFSPDGKRIISGSHDNTVRLWDSQTGQPIGQPFQGHSSAIYSVSFSPDGHRIITGSYDNTVRLWDVDPGNWLVLACNRLQYHPLIEPNRVSEPNYLEVITRVRAVCEQIWRK